MITTSTFSYASASEIASVNILQDGGMMAVTSRLFIFEDSATNTLGITGIQCANTVGISRIGAQLMVGNLVKDYSNFDSCYVDFNKIKKASRTNPVKINFSIKTKEITEIK